MVCPPFILIYMLNISAVAQTALQLQQHYKLHHAKQDALFFMFGFPCIIIYIKRTNVMQLGSMFICNCNTALHVSDAICVHLQEHLETVVVASGE